MAPTLNATPKFSIVTPVFNPPEDAFRACIESVLGQTLDDWQWCVADDGSTEPHVGAMLAGLSEDPRVHVVRRTTNGGIVAASNSAAALATGEFICLLDHDDVLVDTALESVSHAAYLSPHADFMYSDEDKIDEHGNAYDRFWKPEWSPERLRGQNYCSHLSIIRRSLFEEVGGFRDGFDGSQDYDLVLRVTERCRGVVHIPEVLYHWRAIEGSTAADFDAKPVAFESARRALEEHARRVGITGTAEQTPSGYYRIRRHLSRTPLVSVVVPTRGSSKTVWGMDTCLATNAVSSIVERSTYQRYEVVVVYDTVTPPEELEKMYQLLGSRLVAVEYDKEFNFADKINVGAVSASGDVVLMLNDDTQVKTENWIEELIGYLEEPDVGMVGPRLLLGDGRVQSAGHYNVLAPHHLGAGALASDGGPFGMFAVAGERTGVTGACAALRRDVYETVGGLSPTFPRSFNDVDLAFKLIVAGYRIIWTPFAELYHFESLSRDPKVSEDEIRLLYERWETFMSSEPFARGVEQWWTSMPI